MENEKPRDLKGVKRIVVKIGSSLLTDTRKKKIRVSFLRNMAEQISRLQRDKIEVVIVTSGAIASGLFELGLAERPKNISMLQALAAVGQSKLMHAYETNFKKSKLMVAQILLTRDDISHRHRYSNACNTLLELLRKKIIPIVNENDTVAVEEIKFGNNDTLAVLVTHLVGADLLVSLTDTDGFYEQDPAANPKAKLIRDVYKWDSRFENEATNSRSIVGTGGMVTKIKAAKSMMQSGIPMAIANGNRRNVLKLLLQNKPVGTYFHPSLHKMNSRKRWLAYSIKPKGEIVVDGGARKALIEISTSLLPSGVMGILGSWAKGDIVKIIDQEKREIAKGICNYSSAELGQIKGLKSFEIIQKLGYKSADEVVHRDNMVRFTEI